MGNFRDYKLEDTSKFYASHSVLVRWANGDWDGAIKQYFNIDMIETLAMKEGKRRHEETAKYIQENKKLPEWTDGKDILGNNLIIEKYKRVQINDWLFLNYIADLVDVDNKRLFDWKFGKAPSSASLHSKQFPLYAMGLLMDNILIKEAKIWHYDYVKNEADVSIVWISDEVIQDAYDWFETNSSEMFNYLIENDIFSMIKKYKE